MGTVRDGTGRDGSRGAGKRDREKRLERRELSHSAVATFLVGLVGASRHGGRPAIVGGDGGLCQCRLPRTCRPPLGMAGDAFRRYVKIIYPSDSIENAFALQPAENSF